MVFEGLRQKKTDRLPATPWVDEADEERIARDHDGESCMVPGDMSYREWKSGSTSESSLHQNKESGILFSKLMSSGIGELTQITDDSISAVPLVVPDGWDKTKAIKLREACSSVLEAVRDMPVGTEAGMIYDTELNALLEHIVIGKEGEGVVYLPRADETVYYIVVHNHPDNNMLSHHDTMDILRNGNQYGVVAIGNSGRQFYSAFKTEEYDGMEAYGIYFEYYDKFNEAISRKDIGLYMNYLKEFMERLSGNVSFTEVFS